MPEDMFRRVPVRLLTSASILAMGLCAATVFAQDTAQPAVNDRQGQAVFNGISLDQQLAEQYSSPVALDDDAAILQLEAELDAAIAEDATAIGIDERTTIVEMPPGPVQTVLLLLASLALLAFAATVLTLAIRELKKDARQRKRTYRRRVKRRDTSTPVHAN